MSVVSIEKEHLMQTLGKIGLEPITDTYGEDI